MRRAIGLAAGFLAVMVMAAPAQAQREIRLSRAEREALRPTANPSAVIATELAFARTAQEKGQWTAFAEFATKDAVMFAPELVNALQWLKGRANPPTAVKWQPHRVWSSCDGSFVFSTGAWQRPDGSFGYFVTVWQRQKNGDYKWVYDDGDVLAEPLAEPDMLGAHVASCTGQKQTESKVPGNRSSGTSNDATLSWLTTADADGSRRFTVSLLDDETSPVVFDVTFPAPAE